MLFRNKRRVITGGGILLLILMYFSRNLGILVFIGLIIGSLLLFYYIDHAYKFDFPERYYIYIFIVLVAGLILGPNKPPLGFYYRNYYYDKVLHFISPFLMGFVIFFILNQLNVSLKWKLLMTVALVMGILGLFEIGEYMLDLFLDLQLQGVYLADYAKEIVKYEQIVAPIDDTMWDLIMGLIGGGFFALYKGVTLKLNIDY